MFRDVERIGWVEQMEGMVVIWRRGFGEWSVMEPSDLPISRLRYVGYVPRCCFILYTRKNNIVSPLNHTILSGFDSRSCIALHCIG